MKKIICLFLILVAFTSDIFSQYRYNRRKPSYLTSSIKLGYGNSLLKCENIELDSDVSTTFFAPSSSIGLRLGITFKDNFNFSYEALYYSFGQEFDTKDFDNLKIIKINSFDHSLLFRYTGYSGTYFEFGPKLTLINRVRETNTNDDLIYNDTLSLGMFNKYYKSIVVGAGVAPVLKDKFSITIGVRFNYGFDDLMADKNQLIRDEVTIKTTGVVPKPLNDYPEYRLTKIINVQFIVEMTYQFATFGDSRKPGFHLFK